MDDRIILNLKCDEGILRETAKWIVTEMILLYCRDIDGNTTVSQNEGAEE